MTAVPGTERRLLVVEDAHHVPEQLVCPHGLLGHGVAVGGEEEGRGERERDLLGQPGDGGPIPLEGQNASGTKGPVVLAHGLGATECGWVRRLVIGRDAALEGTDPVPSPSTRST